MALFLLSSPMLSHLLLGFLLVFVAPTATTADSIYQFCRSTDAIYTINSTFRSNLNRLLPSLAANGSATGFFNCTAGDVPDRVYGLVLCRGDVTRGPCGTCLDTAAQAIVQNCPNKKSSTVWYDNCMLRYSNVRFFSVPDDVLKVYLRNANRLAEVTQFNRQLNHLMAALVSYAAENRSTLMFATGEAEYGDPDTPKIYGLVQCTRDQSADACKACLRGIVSEIPNMFFGWRGARILKATCNMRYELYPFYTGPALVSVPLATTPPPAALSPPTPPTAAQGKKKKKKPTGTMLGIAITLGAALVLITATCVCCCRRHAKRRELHSTDSKDITAIESLLFDLSTL